jgi:hypothetical protein
MGRQSVFPFTKYSNSELYNPGGETRLSVAVAWVWQMAGNSHISRRQRFGSCRQASSMNPGRNIALAHEKLHPTEGCGAKVALSRSQSSVIWASLVRIMR